MRDNLKTWICAASAAVMLAFSPAVLAQDNADTPAETAKSDKATKDKANKEAPKSDALDLLFKKAQDEINSGQHCGPKPDVKEKPIA